MPLPTWDHIVLVMEENHTAGQVLGSGSAPYLDSLAAGGASFTNYFAISHPSEPNYFALYAGSTEGISDDGTYSYTGQPTLTTRLAAVGKSFVGYVESGSPQKHNPWESFVGDNVEQDFGSFPTNFANLPPVSWVIPNLNDDMHDGSVQQGDSWLQSNIDAYAQWAKTHNSLLIVVWDEDDSGGNNSVACILYGAHVIPGQYSTSLNHYSLLRLQCANFGATPPGNAASATLFPSSAFTTSGGGVATIAVNSPAWLFSPGGWSGDSGRGGAAYRQSWEAGSWASVTWTNDASTTASLLLTNGSSGNTISCWVNGSLQVNAVAASSNLTITGVQANASNTLLIYIHNTPQFGHWTGVNYVRIAGLTINGGSAGTARALRPWGIIYCDSTGEGIHGETDNSDNALKAWTYLVGQSLNAAGYDYNNSSSTGTGWTVRGDNEGDVPAFFTPGDDSNSRWNKITNGVSLLDSAGKVSAYGATGTQPTFVLVDLGINDSIYSVSTGAVTASVSGFVAAWQAAAPGSRIVILIPPSMYNTGSFPNGSAYIAAIKAGAGAASVIDLGSSVSATLNSSGNIAPDGYHYTPSGAAYVAPHIWAALQPLLTSGGSGNMTTTTWDPNNAGGWALSNGNRTALSPNSGSQSDPIWVCQGTPAIQYAGNKLYFEYTVSGAQILTAFALGIGGRGANMANATGSPAPPPSGGVQSSDFIMLSYNSTVTYGGWIIDDPEGVIAFDAPGGNVQAATVIFGDGDTLGVLLDGVNNQVTFTTPNTQFGGTHGPYDVSVLFNGQTLYPSCTSWFTPGPIATINGGSVPFVHALPAGYTALDGASAAPPNPAPSGDTIIIPTIADKTAGTPFNVNIAFTYAANMGTLQWSNEQSGAATLFRPVNAASGGTATLSTDQRTLTLPLLSNALVPHTLIVVDTQFSPSLQSNSITFNVVASGGAPPPQALSFTTPPPASIVSGAQFSVIVAFTVALADFSTLQVNIGSGLIAVNSAAFIVSKALASSGMSATFTLNAGNAGANTLLFRETVSGAQTINANYTVTAAPALSATAVVTYIQLSSSSYQYSIALHNTGTTPIGTFWFAWLDSPAEGFLADFPTFTSPSGWTAIITDGPPPTNGYSIQWVASSAGVAAGASLSGFTFTSGMTPAQLFSPSTIHPPQIPAYSIVYSGAPFSDAGFDLIPTNGGGTLLQSLTIEAIGTQTVNVVFTVVVDLTNPVSSLTGFRYRLDGGTLVQIPSSAVLSTNGLQIHFALTDAVTGSSETIQVLDPNSVPSNIVNFTVNAANTGSNMTDFFNTTSYPPGTANDADVLLVRDTVSGVTRTQTRTNFRAALDKVRTINGGITTDTPSAADVYGRIIHNGTAALTMTMPVLPAQSWLTVQQGANASITMAGVVASDGATAPFRTTRKGQVVAVDYLADGTISVSGFAAGGGYRSVATAVDTPTLADNGGVIAAKYSGITTFTVNDLGENASYTVNVFGTAMPSFAAGSGVTFRHATDNTILASPFSLPRQNSYAVFYCRGDGSVIVGGVLT